jgi:hypothetical protein
MVKEFKVEININNNDLSEKTGAMYNIINA